MLLARTDISLTGSALLRAAKFLGCLTPSPGLAPDRLPSWSAAAKMPAMSAYTIDDLLAIMARLRDPQGGCPWDLEQDFSSIAPYTIEEAYEVADVIDRQAWQELPAELGDLLFQVVFHSQMADERGWFGFADVVQAISEKMVRRHPHVFSDARYADDAAREADWEAIKQAEKGADKAKQGSALDGVSSGLPAMRRAVKLQKAAARCGFDWPEPEPILDKVREETEELQEAIAAGDAEASREELGDLLFVLCNLARRLEIDPGRALREANQKFQRRFRFMEQQASQAGQSLEQLDSDAQEALWRKAKKALSGGDPG